MPKDAWMPYYEGELVDRAVRSYFAWHKARGFDDAQIVQPARTECVRRGNMIRLANSRRELARYEVIATRHGEKLRRIATMPR